MNRMGSGLVIGFIIGLLVNCCVMGFATDYLAKAKGLSKGFAWGFWLGIVGLLVIGFMPMASAEKEFKPATSEEKREGSTVSSVRAQSTADGEKYWTVNPEGGAIALCKEPDGDVLTWLSAGTKIIVVDDCSYANGWLKVQYGSYCGYVKK